MADLIDEYGNPVQLTDEHGNPVRLTDEHGNPMQLTGVATSPTKAATVATAVVAEEVPLPGGGAAREDVPAAVVVEDLPSLPRGAAAGEEVPAPGGVTTVYTEEITIVMSGPGTGVVSGAQLDPLVTEGIMGSAQPQEVGIGGAGVGGGTGGHQVKDQLHRSTSSSSSEDDGQGGRRKKGIKQKLKETFGIGMHKHAQEHTPPGNGGGVNHAAPAAGAAAPHHEHEKKGVMEKIKEKFPGHHHTSA